MQTTAWSPSNRCRWGLSAIRSLGVVFLAPVVLALLLLWWLLARPAALATIDLAIMLGCYLSAASATGPSLSAPEFFAAERTAPFDSTLFDAFVVVLLRSVVLIAVSYVFRYRSVRRTLLSASLTTAVSMVMVAKISLFQLSSSSTPSRWVGSEGLARAIMIAPLVVGCLELLAEFWVPTSYDRMLRSEMALLSSEPHELHRHVTVEYCPASGLSYLVTAPAGDSQPVLVMIHGNLA